MPKPTPSPEPRCVEVRELYPDRSAEVELQMPGILEGMKVQITESTDTDSGEPLTCPATCDGQKCSGCLRHIVPGGDIVAEILSGNQPLSNLAIEEYVVPPLASYRYIQLLKTLRVTSAEFTRLSGDRTFLSDTRRRITDIKRAVETERLDELDQDLRKNPLFVLSDIHNHLTNEHHLDAQTRIVTRFYGFDEGFMTDYIDELFGYKNPIASGLKILYFGDHKPDAMKRDRLAVASELTGITHTALSARIPELIKGLVARATEEGLGSLESRNIRFDHRLLRYVTGTRRDLFLDIGTVIANDPNYGKFSLAEIMAHKEKVIEYFNGVYSYHPHTADRIKVNLDLLEKALGLTINTQPTE